VGDRLTSPLRDAASGESGDRPVSVICTVRNEARHVAAAILSALTPDVREVLIVDDGSTDGTPGVLHSLAARDPRVRVLHCSRPGRGPALDTAFRAASGEFVMNIDADDALHPEWSRRATALLRADDSLAAVSAAPRYIGDDDAIEWTILEHAPQCRDVTAWVAYCNPVTHSSALMRRSAVDAVGGYDNSLRTHLDYDLWIRLAANRWRLGAVGPRMVAKRLHSGQKFERHHRIAYLRASCAMQARGIRAVKAGVGAWLSLVARILWGLLPRGFRIGARRLLAGTLLRRDFDATGGRLERMHPPVRQI
jgi:glycosyltransferase involved in cell wall biosynthesis